MPPALALVLTLLFIAVLFVRDYRERYAPSLPMLVPCLWVFLRCSRSVTEWTGILLGLGPPMGGGDIEDGTPIDRAVLFILMGAGLSILLHRGISWSNVVRSNLALWMFFPASFVGRRSYVSINGQSRSACLSPVYKILSTFGENILGMDWRCSIYRGYNKQESTGVCFDGVRVVIGMETLPKLGFESRK